MRPMTCQFEESELVDVVEVRYELVQVKQQKYGSSRDTASSSPPRRCAIWPTRLRSGSRSSTRALTAHVPQRSMIGLDQTGWQRLESASSKPWQMWCLTAPGVVVHRIRDNKSRECRDLHRSRRQLHRHDRLRRARDPGAGARASLGVTLAGCWAHVFRKFEEAKPESAAILAEFKNWLWELDTLTSISIGKAAAYAIANCDRLTRFVDEAAFLSTTTRPSARSAVRSSAARITTDRSRAAAPRSPPRCTRSSRPRSSTESIRPRISPLRSPPAIAAQRCCPGTSPPRSARTPPRRSPAPTAFTSRCHDVAARELTTHAATVADIWRMSRTFTLVTDWE
jgi:hypothetical protein